MNENENKYTIYKHTSPRGKVYIGQTKRSPASERWKYPKYAYKTCTKLLHAIEKYGWENFTTEIIDANLSLEKANELEQFYIKKYDTVSSGYNVQEGGKNYKRRLYSDETRKKMSDSRKKIMTPEFRKQIGKAHIGNKHRLGHIFSEETRKKMSESAKLAWEEKKKIKLHENTNNTTSESP